MIETFCSYGANGFGCGSTALYPLWQIFVAPYPNGLIPSDLALKVMPQETHSIALKKKMTTTY